LKHENAELVLSADKHVVVYMGDDERGEFLYKFVSASQYDAKDDPSDLLDDGTLSVAIFNDDMTGHWVALTPEATGMVSKPRFVSTQGSRRLRSRRPQWTAPNGLLHILAKQRFMSR
jgi:secreted PhoX family phosphatase